jgi:hypothetical protein
VQGDWDAEATRGHHGEAGDLRSAHHRADVVLAEDALDGDDVGGEARDDVCECIRLSEQARGGVLIGGRADDIDVDERQRASWGALDHADTAARQPRIDTQHAHTVSSDRTDVR